MKIGLLSSLASNLDLSILPNDVANVVRLGRSSVSRPLIVKFMSIIKRNEWLAAARRKCGIIVRDIEESWPSDKISVYERSTASKRLALKKAFAQSYNVTRVWMRRGVIYFRESDDSQIRRFSSIEYFIKTIFAARQAAPLSLPSSMPIRSRSSVASFNGVTTL